jgi:type III secretory pathway component EscV
MRKFTFLALLLLLGSFLLTGCKGKESTAEGGEETSTEKQVEKASEEENPLLTEKEVVAFIEAFPVFVKITKKAEKEIDPLSDKKNLVSGMRVAGKFQQYAEELDAGLKDYGFTFETFSATYAKVMAAFAFGQMNEAMESSKVQMKQMLDNPNIPEEQKEEIREGLKEMEESEEMKAAKENWKIVEKHKDELIEILQEQQEA